MIQFSKNNSIITTYLSQRGTISPAEILLYYTAMNNRLNKYKYPGAKRLMLEAQELKDNTEDYCAQPIDDNLFEWHFTVRGPPDTAFDGGYYHGRLSFPTEYPMKPPSIILLTPNGRFEINKKICLSISGYHPETWQPSWSVRTALLALIAFMPTKANRAIGSLDFPDAERRRLALKSRTWRCESCGLIKELLVHPNHVVGHMDSSTAYSTPGTSRVSESSATLERDRRSQSSGSTSSNNSGNSSSSECRDSSPESEVENHSKNSRQGERSTNVQDQPNTIQNYPASSTSVQERLNSTQSIAHHSANQAQEDDVNPNLLQNLAERRRAYPPLVLKSVFILLSLLILRRVVMVIQS